MTGVRLGMTGVKIIFIHTYDAMIRTFIYQHRKKNFFEVYIFNL